MISAFGSELAQTADQAEKANIAGSETTSLGRHGSDESHDKI